MLLAGVPGLAVAQSITLPGEFAFCTKKGYYLTAIRGCGRSDAAISAGPWGMLFTTRRTEITDKEKFEFLMSGLGSPPILH
jgi:hypothetical protein